MQKSILVGVALALIEAFLTWAVLRIAGNKYFYWVWFGSTIFRLFLVLVTAFTVTKFVDVSVPVTLISMVSLMTVLLFAKSFRIYKKRS